VTGAGAGTVRGGAADERIETGSGNDVLDGGAGNDTLDGGLGNDAMTGGAGNDVFIVDNASDTVAENAGEGTDEVRTALASYSIAGVANVENLTGTATSGQSLTGNSLANVIAGGIGADTMTGGAGDDTYVVNNASDTVTEAASEGTDTVQSSITYTLGANVENLVLTGIAAINGTGNTLANTITGNAAANLIDGGTGADAMIGGGGNDSYVVDNVADTITEATGGGTDSVSSSVTYTLSAEVENLTLTGVGNINGTGNTS